MTHLQGPEFTPPEYLKDVEKLIPMGHIASPEECAGAYLFLAAEPLSGYITGQIIVVGAIDAHDHGVGHGGTFSP